MESLQEKNVGLWILQEFRWPRVKGLLLILLLGGSWPRVYLWGPNPPDVFTSMVEFHLVQVLECVTINCMQQLTDTKTSPSTSQGVFLDRFWALDKLESYASREATCDSLPKWMSLYRPDKLKMCGNGGWLSPAVAIMFWPSTRWPTLLETKSKRRCLLVFAVMLYRKSSNDMETATPENGDSKPQACFYHTSTKALANYHHRFVRIGQCLAPSSHSWCPWHEATLVKSSQTMSWRCSQKIAEKSVNLFENHRDPTSAKMIRYRALTCLNEPKWETSAYHMHLSDRDTQLRFASWIFVACFCAGDYLGAWYILVTSTIHMFDKSLMSLSHYMMPAASNNFTSVLHVKTPIWSWCWTIRLA